MPPQLQEVQRWRGGDRGTRPVLWIRQGRPEWVKREGESVSRSVASDSCDPMDCSPPGSTVHGIVQARILEDRKSTRLNSSHQKISYAVFCLKKTKNATQCVRGRLREGARTTWVRQIL